MQITPARFLDILYADKTLTKSILDIEDKIERIISNQPPVFFGQYTDHGINHFRDTLKRALHLVCIDEMECKPVQKAVVEYLSPLNVFVLSAAVLFHDLGMHIHFNGFKQLINGFYDDVRVEFFNDLTWKEEWDNFMIEAKRFSGRERVNLFGDEQVTVKDIDFSKNSVDSDIQKHLIGEFIRRHHGRLAHEIALKGFPFKGEEVIQFANDLQPEYKDIFGLIARSHSMNVRDAMEYIEEMFPGDPHFPYSIEVPFLMCVLRIADYFQIDNTRTNVFLVKLKSFTSPYSLNEHRAHLSTEYFKTDEKDPETLYVDAKPKDGLMYTKLLGLFDDIQNELDTSFAIIGEMYGRNRTYFKLRYRRIKTNLKNRRVIARYDYVPDVYRFEADTDLFKLLVGPLYGNDPSYGVREMIQNAVDACIELQYKLSDSYEPVIDINVENREDKEYVFTITDNGKGMSLGEIKNYYLKAGASFRNSTEWKMDYQRDDNSSSIRRVGKFGIGVLASFLVGDIIEVTTKRYNEPVGYTFNADLTHEFIELRKNNNCSVGTKIIIKIGKKTYDLFKNEPFSFMKWYVLSSPTINYYLDNKAIRIDRSQHIDLDGGKQKYKNAISLDHKDFDDIIWTYEKMEGIAINGIAIPGWKYKPDFYERLKSKEWVVKDQLNLKNYPFLSVIDRDNIIGLELNRNSIRGDLPFEKELMHQCVLDFLSTLLLFESPIVGNVVRFTRDNGQGGDGVWPIFLNTFQFGKEEIYVTSEGYFPDNAFYYPLLKEITFYKVCSYSKTEIALLPNSSCSFFKITEGKEFNYINPPRGNSDPILASLTSILYENMTYKHDHSLKESLRFMHNRKEYLIASAEELVADRKEKLIEFFKMNELGAVQLVNKVLTITDGLTQYFQRHFGKPTLIPHDWEKRKAYIKTLHPDLIKYITEKRSISLD